MRTLGGLLCLGAALVATAGAAQPPPSLDNTSPSAVVDALDAWDIDQAQDALSKLIAQGRTAAPVLEYLKGRIAFELGQYDDAVQSLSKADRSLAAAEQGPIAFLRLAENTRRVMRNHGSQASTHFVFFFPRGKDEALAPYGLEALEKMRAALENDLGYAPSRPVRVEVVNDAKELSKVSTLTEEQIRATGTIAVCKFNKLIITSPKAVLHGYDWLDTLAHEYTHLVISKRSRNTVPIWLHEGIAKFLEVRWRGPAGLELPAPVLWLLAKRVKQNDLVSFERMHPSIAMLPTAEDAATAFAEVSFAVDRIWKTKGPAGLKGILDRLREGHTDREAVEAVLQTPFARFEKGYLAELKRTALASGAPKAELDRVVLKDPSLRDAKKVKKEDREITYADFADVEDLEARRFSHLGELMREISRPAAATIEYTKAYQRVGDRYESISNKLALALIDTGRLAEAERILNRSLKVHPIAAQTYVHLGRIYLAEKRYEQAAEAYQQALGKDPFDSEVHRGMLAAFRALGKGELSVREDQVLKILSN